MKVFYEPEINIYHFDSEDILTASPDAIVYGSEDWEKLFGKD